MHHRLILTFAILLIVAVPAAAQTLTFAADQDNTIWEPIEPDTTLGGIILNSNGVGPHIFAGRAGDLRRGLVRFDLSGVAPGTEIDQVTLKLFMDRTIAGPTDVSLHAVTTAWGEGTSNSEVDGGGGGGGGGGALATIGDATWLHGFFDTDLWTTPGGDFVAAASATTTVDQAGAYSWTSAQLAADVQAWVDDPSSNHGWIIVGVEDGDPTDATAKRFISREGPPDPEVTTPPGGPAPFVPELLVGVAGDPIVAIPTLSEWGMGLMMLLLAAFALWRVRRVTA
ncbi:MAG: IPTL-CTERM sorting domain-containing protein [Acidobacteriota bacterium]